MADDIANAARPYAKAVFEVAEQQQRFDDWSARLEFWGAVVANPEMRKRLRSPQVSQDEKAGMLEEVARDGMDDESRRFIRLLADNNRLDLLPDIHTHYEALRRDAEGEVEASVVSAFELDDGQRERIANALGERLKRRIRLTSEVDRELIGGAIVRAGDLVIDGSVRGRIDRMTTRIVN